MSLSRSLGSLVVRIAAEGIGAYKSDLNAAADATTQAGGRIERSYDQTSKAAQKASKAQVEASQKSVDKLKLQADTFGASARESTLYKMALEGATASQLKQADAALNSVEAMKQGHQWGERMGTAMRVGALLAVTGAVAAAAAFESLIGSVAKYQDKAEQTGGDPAGLASLRTAADVGGSSIDSLALSASRLQANLAKVDDESKGVGQALAAIGVEVEAFKNLRPDEQLREIGKALNQYADGGEKVAVIQGILGRGSQVQLSALKELGNETQSYNTLTNAQIALADDYKDAQARMTSEVLQAAEAVAAQMLPALTALTGAGKEVILEMLGVSKGASDLENNKAIQEWAKGGALAVAAFADVLLNIVNIARVVGASIRSVFADISLVATVVDKAGVRGAGLLFQKNRDDISKAMDERNKIVAKSDAALLDMLNGDRVTTALKKQFSEATRKSNQGVYGGIPSDGKAAIDYNTAAARKGGRGGSAAAKVTDYERMAEAIGKVTALQQQELDHGGKLSAAAKFQFDEMQKINFALQTKKISQAESIKLTDMTTVAVAKMVEVEKQAANIKANVAGYADEIQFRKELFDAEENVRQARQRSTETLLEYSKAVEADNELTAFELSLVGQTEEAKRREIALYRVEIELLKQKDAIKKNMPYDAAGQSEAFAKAEATAAISRAGVTSKAQLDAANKYKDEQVKLWSEIDNKAESVFMDIAKNGTSAFKHLEDELKNGLLKLLYEMTVKKWIISIGSDLTGLDLGKLMGGSGTGSSSLSGLGGGLMQAITGGSVGASSASLMGANAVGAMGGDAMGTFIGMNGGWSGVAGPAVEGLATLAPALETIGVLSTTAAPAVIGAGTGIAGLGAAALAAIPVVGWVALGIGALFAIFGSGKDKIPTVLNDLALFNNSLVGLPFLELAIGSDEVAQGLRDVLYGLENASPTMRKLAGETLNLSVELMRSAGDIAGARNLARNLGTRGMSEEEVGLFDKNQAMRDQIEANNAASAAASAGAAAAREAEQAENTLAQSRYNIAGKLNILLGRTTQLEFDRATALAATSDAASIGMLTLTYQLEDLNSAVDASYAKLERSIAKEKELATTRLKGATDLAAALKTAKDAISPSLSTATARSQLAMFVALAKSAGILPSAEAIKPTLDSLSKVSTDDYKTANEYYRDQAITANDISELAGYAGEQVSAEQQTIDRLDMQLDTAKQALDVLKGIDNSIVSVAAADAAFYAAMVSLTAAQAGATAYSYAAPAAVASSYGGGGGYAGGGASSASSAASATAGMDSDMVAAFQAYYGRNPDQAGYDNFVKSGLTGDAMMQAILHASIADKNGADYAYAISHGYDPENPLSNFYHGKNKYKASTAAVVEDFGSFAIGSNYIPEDQNARIHKGEEITPRPYVDMQRASREESNRLMERLVQSNERLEKKVESLQAAADKTATNTGKTEETFRRMSSDGMSLNTKAVA